MQHKHHSYKYVLYVYVSCASSRWNWPNRNIVQHQTGFKNNLRLKYCLVIWSLSRLFEISSWSSLSPLISYKHACLHLWYNVNWTFFHLLFVFSARSANMMYSVFCCSLFLLVFPAPGPRKDVSERQRAGHLWKSPRREKLGCHSLKP